MIWLRLIFNDFTGIAVLVIGLLFVGNAYGCNARQLEGIKVAQKAENAELRQQSATEAAAGAAQDARLHDQLAAFKKQKVGQCILNQPTAEALSLIRG